MSEIWKTIAHTSGARLYGLLLGVVSLALTARWLGPEGRGIVVAVTTWVSLFTTIGYLSLGQVAIYRASQDEEDEWMPPVFGALLFMLIVMSAAGWIIAAVLYLFSEGEIFRGLPGWYLLIGFVGLPLMIWEHYGSSLLMAIERLDISNRYQVIASTLAISALFVFILGWQWGVAGALLSILLGHTVRVVGGVVFLKRRVGRPRLDWSELRALLANGAKLHLNAIGTFLFSGSDILMLNHYAGASAAGFYQLAFQLTSVFLIIPQAATVVIYGKISRHGADGAWQYHRKVIVGLIVLMTILCGIAFIIAPWGITLFAGANFSPSIELFRWLLLAVLGMTLSQLLSPQWIGRGLFLQAAFLTLFVGLANLVANYHMIPKYGALGAVWASLGVYLFAILGNGIMALYCERRFRKTTDLICK